MPVRRRIVPRGGRKKGGTKHSTSESQLHESEHVSEGSKSVAPTCTIANLIPSDKRKIQGVMNKLIEKTSEADSLRQDLEKANSQVAELHDQLSKIVGEFSLLRRRYSQSVLLLEQYTTAFGSLDDGKRRITPIHAASLTVSDTVGDSTASEHISNPYSSEDEIVTHSVGIEIGVETDDVRPSLASVCIETETPDVRSISVGPDLSDAVFVAVQTDPLPKHELSIPSSSIRLATDAATLQRLRGPVQLLGPLPKDKIPLLTDENDDIFDLSPEESSVTSQCIAVDRSHHTLSLSEDHSSKLHSYRPELSQNSPSVELISSIVADLSLNLSEIQRSLAQRSSGHFTDESVDSLLALISEIG